jgi:FixJ family two-component response regulator
MKRLSALPPRQPEVLNLISIERSIKLTAYDLGVSQRIVEHHRRRLLNRARVRTLPELGRLAAVAETLGSISRFRQT